MAEEGAYVCEGGFCGGEVGEEGTEEERNEVGEAGP